MKKVSTSKSLIEKTNPELESENLYFKQPDFDGENIIPKDLQESKGNFIQKVLTI